MNSKSTEFPNIQQSEIELGCFKKQGFDGAAWCSSMCMQSMHIICSESRLQGKHVQFYMGRCYQTHLRLVTCLILLLFGHCTIRKPCCCQIFETHSLRYLTSYWFVNRSLRSWDLDISLVFVERAGCCNSYFSQFTHTLQFTTCVSYPVLHHT